MQAGNGSYRRPSPPPVHGNPESGVRIRSRRAGNGPTAPTTNPTSSKEGLENRVRTVEPQRGSGTGGACRPGPGPSQAVRSGRPGTHQQARSLKRNINQSRRANNKVRNSSDWRVSLYPEKVAGSNPGRGRSACTCGDLNEKQGLSAGQEYTMTDGPNQKGKIHR